MKSFRFGFALLASAAAPSTAAPPPPQAEYAAVNDRWFIYVEERSCALYVDTDEGTTYRFSNRTDEGRVYFSAINEHWQHLRPRVGEGGMVLLRFPALERGLGAVTQVIEYPDGRLGYTAADFEPETMFRLLSSGGEMVLSVSLGSGTMTEVERLPLTDGAVAANHLVECTRDHFSEGVSQ